MLNLRTLRLMRDLSQVGLSHISGVHANIISQAEIGRLRPYPKQLNKLAEALGVEGKDAHRLLEEREIPADTPAWWGLGETSCQEREPSPGGQTEGPVTARVDV